MNDRPQTIDLGAAQQLAKKAAVQNQMQQKVLLLQTAATIAGHLMAIEYQAAQQRDEHEKDIHGIKEDDDREYTVNIGGPINLALGTAKELMKAIKLG